MCVSHFFFLAIGNGHGIRKRVKNDWIDTQNVDSKSSRSCRRKMRMIYLPASAGSYGGRFYICSLRRWRLIGICDFWYFPSLFRRVLANSIHQQYNPSGNLGQSSLFSPSRQNKLCLGTKAFSWWPKAFSWWPRHKKIQKYFFYYGHGTGQCAARRTHNGHFKTTMERESTGSAVKHCCLFHKTK